MRIFTWIFASLPPAFYEHVDDNSDCDGERVHNDNDESVGDIKDDNDYGDDGVGDCDGSHGGEHYDSGDGGDVVMVKVAMMTVTVCILFSLHFQLRSFI